MELNSMLPTNAKLALYMEQSLTIPAGKMGHGVLRYSPNEISAVIDSEFAGRSTGEFGFPRDVPIVASVEDSAALGANVFVLGIAPSGGAIPAEWFTVIDRAVELKMSLVNGLHDRLGARYTDLPRLEDASPVAQWVWDIRVEPSGLVNGTGLAAKFENRRVLIIGTDMAVGKMTAGLEINRLALERGIKSAFVATGQIGITITGGGVPLDCVRVDFASGSIEREVVAASSAGADLVIIEGQGSLAHPSSTANLPLLRGSCPTHLLLCVRAKQEHLKMLEHIKVPDLRQFITLYEDLAEAAGTYLRPKTVAVAVNTAHLSEAEAIPAIEEIEDRLQLPAADPVRQGPARLLDALVSP
jgi:uncharacterized NAD-dependent epimerase/dehydratase family protein